MREMETNRQGTVTNTQRVAIILRKTRERRAKSMREIKILQSISLHKGVTVSTHSLIHTGSTLFTSLS